VTLHDDLTRTAALLGDGYRIDNLARAKRAQEINEAMPTTRHDPGAESLPRRPRRSALFGRQIVPVLHVEAAPDPVVDEAAEFCATEIDAPTIVRRARTLTEAARAYADAQARDAVSLDPAHGIAQSDGIRDARRRRAGVVAAQAVKDLDGAAPPMIVATLILEALERDGVL